MNTLNTTPKFDCIDYSKEAPEGMAYAYGWDHHGTCYFGIVYVDDEGVIGKAISWVTMPYSFGLTETSEDLFRKQFLEDYITITSKAS